MMTQGDLFGGESLAVRRARRDPLRGALDWALCSSHDTPSTVADLLYWGAYLHRERLCGHNAFNDTAHLDDAFRDVLKHCTLVQCDLVQARRYEIRLGVRFNRGDVLRAHRERTFSRELRAAYSHGLLHMYLERVEVVSQWGDPPDPLAPLTVRP